MPKNILGSNFTWLAKVFYIFPCMAVTDIGICSVDLASKRMLQYFGVIKDEAIGWWAQMSNYVVGVI